ncbi:MAG: hypothetical protein ABUL46_03095 [Chitinophaga rupis]
MKKLFIMLPGLLLLMACGTTTRIESSWRDPEVVVNTDALNKFVIAALIKNQTVRRNIEDKVAATYPGKAIPSYKEFGVDELKESDEVYTKKLKEEGFDGVVIMRMVKVDKDTRYVPGSYPPYYGRWWGYWRYSWPGFYDPGYYTVDRTYYVEVNVYSLIRNKLVWSGVTSTINPGGGDKLFDSVTKAVVKKMKSEGFLKS